MKSTQAPFIQDPVYCGLFGVSEDFSVAALSLDEKFELAKESVFLVRARSDSMSPYIQDGDVLVVDRSLPVKNGLIATFYINGNSVCKKFLKKEGRVWLVSLNSRYNPIEVKEDDVLEVFGVVTGVIRSIDKLYG